MNLIDNIDSEVINLLVKNGRTPNTEIAKRLNVSETTIRKRLKRLIDNRIIKIIAVVNQNKHGYALGGNIKIKTDIRKTDVVIDSFKKQEGIWYIAQLTGAYNFDVEFRAKSIEKFRELINEINLTEGVLETSVSFRLKLIKKPND